MMARGTRKKQPLGPATPLAAARAAAKKHRLLRTKAKAVAKALTGFGFTKYKHFFEAAAERHPTRVAYAFIREAASGTLRRAEIRMRGDGTLYKVGKKTNKPKKRHNGSSKVVSLLFDEERWTVARAKRWLKDHGYRYGRVKPVGLYIHAPQVAAGVKFKQYATKDFGTGGIKARMGFR